jgi:hypothetical protein
MSLRFLTGAAAVALLAALAPVSPASAQEAAPAAAPAAPAHPSWNGITFSGHIEGGTNVNPDSPENNVNQGQLMTDRANSFRVNQLMLTAQKDIDPASSEFNWGFKLQGMYGTDARITHYFNEGDLWTNSPYQWDITEANLQAHLPIYFPGGMDVKIGQYSTPMGYEVIDATGNFFYTHSYIFNYGLPLKHTGVLTTSHVTDMIDVYAGFDMGNQASLPTRYGDNNATGAFLGGFGINNPIPNLTILALAHIGAENGYVKGTPATPGINGHSRQIYDVTSTYHVNDQLTVANEINFTKDDLFGATAEGTAFYGIYKWSDAWSFGARGEVYRDDQGFFVSSVGGSQDFVRLERANLLPTSAVYAAGPATYTELTLGANWAPALAFPSALPPSLGLTLRPEFRWDHAFSVGGTGNAFNMNSSGTFTKNDQFLLSVDAILAF